MAHIQSIHQFKQKNINISLENFNLLNETNMAHIQSIHQFKQKISILV